MWLPSECLRRLVTGSVLCVTAAGEKPGCLPNKGLGTSHGLG